MDIFVRAMELVIWPAVTLVIFFCAKGQVMELVGRIARVKVRDVEVELRDKIVSLAKQADHLPRHKRLENEREPRPADGLIKAKEIDSVERQPVAAIINKWEDIERALFQRVIGISGRKWDGALSAVDYLVADKIMTKDEVKLFNRLYEIRNIVAHEADSSRLSAGYAFEFVRTANMLIAKLGTGAE